MTSLAENISAMVLCAGRSTRMGTCKGLLPFRGGTIAEQPIRLFRSVAIEDILFVLGHEHDRITRVLENHPVRWTINSRYDEGMFSSIQCGIRALGAVRGFFILPVYMPLVRPETLEILLRSFQEGGALICRPSHEGKRGHPPLLSSALIPNLLRYEGEGGLRTFLREHAAESIDMPCGDPGILADLDRMEHYLGIPPDLR